MPMRQRRPFIARLAHGEAVRDVLEPVIERDEPAALRWRALSVTEQRQMLALMPRMPILRPTNKVLRLLETIRRESFHWQDESARR